MTDAPLKIIGKIHFRIILYDYYVDITDESAVKINIKYDSYIKS